MDNQNRAFYLKKTVLLCILSLGKLLYSSRYYKVVVSIREIIHENFAQCASYSKPIKIFTTIVVLLLSIFIFTEFPNKSVPHWRNMKVLNVCC